MARSPELRLRAQQLFLADWPAARIATELGVGRATVQRWVDRHEWRELRALQARLERSAAALVVELTEAARESRDPQQAYAAVSAAELARPRFSVAPGPQPMEIAEALLDAIAADPELGPVVRRRRADVVATVAAALERLRGATEN